MKSRALREAVMPGFMPGIHAFPTGTAKAWMAGTSPAMTSIECFCNKLETLAAFSVRL